MLLLLLLLLMLMLCACSHTYQPIIVAHFSLSSALSSRHPSASLSLHSEQRSISQSVEGAPELERQSFGFACLFGLARPAKSGTKTKQKKARGQIVSPRVTCYFGMPCRLPLPSSWLQSCHHHRSLPLLRYRHIHEYQHTGNAAPSVALQPRTSLAHPHSSVCGSIKRPHCP